MSQQGAPAGPAAAQAATALVAAQGQPAHAPGAIAEFVGLQSEGGQALVGHTGRLVKYEATRWNVVVLEGSMSGETKKINAGNLKVLQRASDGEDAQAAMYQEVAQKHGEQNRWALGLWCNLPGMPGPSAVPAASLGESLQPLGLWVASIRVTSRRGELSATRPPGS